MDKTRRAVDGPTNSHTPNNPTKAPNIPTGPTANRKTSNSKVMAPIKPRR